MRFEITGQHLIVNGTTHHATFDIRLHGATSHEEYVRAARWMHSHMDALNANLSLSQKPDELPEPTGPVILGAESLVGARLTRAEADAKIQGVRAQNPDPEVVKAVEDYVSRVIEPRVVFVKPSEPAEPQEVVCETPSIILAKESQVEDAKRVIQSVGSNIVEELAQNLQKAYGVSQVEHDIGPEPEIAELEPSEKDKLATAFELDCFEKVNSPETAAKLWEEYKERVSAYGDAYRKMRATSLVMAVVDHNEGLTVPEAGALIQAEIKKLNAKPAEKTPENVQPEAPEDITPLVEKFIEALKEFDNKPNVSESELFRLLAVTCASPMPDRKVNPTKAFAVLDGATTLHKVPLLVKTFPDMTATKEKILGDASKTKKFSMMCAAAKIQIEK